nr:MAG TPA: hypothetical protein [Caudoviricetes sp.]
MPMFIEDVRSTRILGIVKKFKIITNQLFHI